jgi:hypothetical protein
MRCKHENTAALLKLAEGGGGSNQANGLIAWKLSGVRATLITLASQGKNLSIHGRLRQCNPVREREREREKERIAEEGVKGPSSGRNNCILYFLWEILKKSK